MSYIIKGADNQPILHQGKEIHAMDLTGVVKSVDLEKRLLKMVGTDETRDRDGDIVKLSGWMLENYIKNPVFLWCHDYRSVPLAAAQKVIKKRSSNAMEFHLRFPSADLYPFADMILNLYNESIINASSVGFIPFKWEDLTDEERQDMSPMAQMWGGRKFTKQELLELSGCAVPSNPNALQNSMAAKSFSEKYHLDLEQVSRFIMQSSIHSPIEALGAKSDDVYQELKLDKCAFEDEDDPKVHLVPVQIDGVDVKRQPLGASVALEVKATEDPPQVEKGDPSPGATEKQLRVYYSEKFGVDLSEGKFAVIESQKLQGVDEGKTIIRYLSFEDGKLLPIKEEVIDSKDLEPDGKAVPVLSRKDRELFTQARDILDEVLKAPSEESAGEEDLGKSGAGDTIADRTLQEQLGKIKTIIENINKSFGG